MGYSSKGRKPIERASKIAHAEIINNSDVVAFVDRCVLPAAAPPSTLAGQIQGLPSAVDTSDVQVVVAIDGGYTETYVREEFPSASIAFFTFGPLLFELADLRALDRQRFIAPEDLAKLKHLERYTLTLPTRGIRLQGEDSLSSTIRRGIYEFFTRRREPDDEPLINSLIWFLFRRWEKDPDDGRKEVVERCPNQACAEEKIAFLYNSPTQCACPGCGKSIYLIDVFRLHERIDDELGAGAILAYVMTMLEQLVLVHVIYTILRLKRALLGKILFLKDGPLAFFGLVAPLYRPMRELTTFLLAQPSPDGMSVDAMLLLAGLEKSGAFVEHAAAIQGLMTAGSYLLTDNAYIYKYIIPGDPAAQVYGSNTYYGQKVFFHAPTGEMYVITVPSLKYSPAPIVSDIPGLEKILALIGELRCSMYDNALVPVALANKLVSLSDFPSQRILTTFARKALI